MILIPIILILITLLWIRYLYQKNISLKYQYRFYALRDQLRKLAIDGKIDPDGTVFDFLDFSISNAIDDLPNLTLWSLTAFRITAIRKRKYHDFKVSMESEIDKNESAKQIYQEMGAILVHCTLSKHKFSIVAALAAFLPLIGLAKIYSQVRSKAVEDIMELRDQAFIVYS
jgi:hypothetical protein